MLPVNEIFATIQGEASFAGTPATFVRLQGCDVGCPWCDTKHTWKEDPAHQVTFDAMVGKKGDGHAYAMATIPEIAQHVGKLKPRHIVITGGEPCQHNLNHLTAELIARHLSVQIETSGTALIRCHPSTFVTLSPKIDMPGGLVVRSDAIERANEIKMPVGKLADIDRLKAIALGRRKRPIWLQPLSQSPKATQLCVEQATDNDWRVSIQIHRYLGVR